MLADRDKQMASCAMFAPQETGIGTLDIAIIRSAAACSFYGAIYKRITS